MLPNLEKIHIYSEYISHVIALESLEFLEIILRNEHLSEVINYLTMSSGLQTLALYVDSHTQERLPHDALIEAICTCTSLHSISLSNMPDISRNIIEFAESLPLLNIFQLQFSYPSPNGCDWLVFVEKAKRLELLGIELKPVPIDFAEKVRLIVGRRELSHRQLSIIWENDDPASWLHIVGSHITDKGNF